MYGPDEAQFRLSVSLLEILHKGSLYWQQAYPAEMEAIGTQQVPKHTVLFRLTGQNNYF